MISNDFSRARFRLVTLYLVIVASVIVLFSFLVIRQADDARSSASADRPFVITTEEALLRTEALMPGVEVTDTEYEIEDNDLYLTVEFQGDRDVKANLFTGTIALDTGSETLLEILTDDFDEMVLWIGISVFLLAALLSHYVANRTMQPIANNIRKQKQFVSGAAHELRNPLAALHSRIEAALRSREHENSYNVLRDLLAETKRLIALSEELLLIERDEQRTRDPQLCLVKKSVTAVIDRLTPVMKEKKIDVREDIADAPLRIDPHDLETVLYNLLHNAVKFSEKNTTVRIMWKKGILSVSDQGPGISENHVPHLFERFYKAETNTEGTGLGLSLVHDVVKRYGGSIRVESSVGKGTTFFVTFS
jgi:signal transduction histidine kinase